MINRYQYGKEDPGNLGGRLIQADAPGKKMAGGSTASACVPGGYVVNASSEPGRLAVNGMSYHDRGQPERQQRADRYGDAGRFSGEKALWQE